MQKIHLINYNIALPQLPIYGLTPLHLHLNIIIINNNNKLNIIRVSTTYIDTLFTQVYTTPTTLFYR
jgi:hypothetical protein